MMYTLDPHTWLIQPKMAPLQTFLLGEEDVSSIEILRTCYIPPIDGGLERDLNSVSFLLSLWEVMALRFCVPER